MTLTTEPLHVIMFPGSGNKDENRYIDVLVQSLRTAGVVVESWDKHLSRQQGNIFHVHWPQVISDIRDREYQSLRGHWIAWQFFRTIARVKRRGGRIVWTVHDIVPHTVPLRGPAFLEKLMRRFLLAVDLAISLTFVGIEEIKEAIPSLATKPMCVARHPHYRGVLGPGHYDLEMRARLGIARAQTAFAFIGSLRVNKRPDLVALAFRDLPVGEAFLIMAGSASVDMAQRICAILSARSNVKLDILASSERIPERDVIELHAVSDIFVFPGTDYFNSGTVYTALSLSVPVIAAWSRSNEELQNIVGRRWLHLYRGEFTRSTLEEAAGALIKRDRGDTCDLSAFSPETSALEHIAAYRRALS
jgi:glycosyltransferase involved in cell wall biosynthesis